MECFHACIPSHSPTPSHMPMPSVTTIIGSTNETHIPSPRRLTDNQCLYHWVTNPESTLIPITQLEVEVITMTVFFYFWETKLFGLHNGLLHQHRTFWIAPLVSHTYRTFWISPRVSYTRIPGFSHEGINGPLLASPNTHNSISFY